jgi:hypothetical protein
MERDHQAYDLFRRGLSYRQVAAQMGYKSHASVQEAVRRAARDNATDPLEQAEARQAALDRLQDYRRAAQKVLMGRHLQVSQAGKLVTDKDGHPLTDPDPPLRALAQLRWVEQEDNRLRDLYPAAKHEVRQIDAIDARLLDLADAVALGDARAAQELPSPA